MHKLSRSALVLVSVAVGACAAPESPSDEDSGDALSTITSTWYPQCGGSVTDVTPVELSWGYKGPATFTAGAPLVISNVTPDPLTVQISARFRGPTDVVTTSLVPVTVPGHDKKSVVVQTSSIGTIAKDADTPIGVVVSAVADGQVAWAPARFVQAAGSKAYAWYDAAQAAQQTQATVTSLLAAHQVQLSPVEVEAVDTMQVVDPVRSFPDLAGAWAYATTLDPSAFAAVSTLAGGGTLGGGGPSGGPPSNVQTLCYRLNTDFATGGVGFADMPHHEARGAKIWLTVPFVGTFFGVTSRENGCVNIPALPDGFVFFTGLYFEAHVGANANRDIMVRTFDVPGSPWSFAEWDGTPFDVPRNAFMVVSDGQGSVTPLSTHVNNWRMANMLAVGSQVMSYYDAELGNGAPFTHDVAFEVNGCQHGDDVSCAWDDEGHITEHDGGPRKAELIGHEFGHIVDSVYASAHFDGNYGIQDDNPQCDGFGELHALNSREHQGGAALEGLASALGAVALSEPGSSSWRYYKSIPASDGLYTNQVIDLESVADRDHLENACSCLPSDCISVFGVESDWLRFFWGYWPNADADMDVVFQRVSSAAALAGNGDAFERLRLATPVGAARDTIEAYGATHGADGLPGN
jgi:hypothetical protein